MSSRVNFRARLSKLIDRSSSTSALQTDEAIQSHTSNDSDGEACRAGVATSINSSPMFERKSIATESLTASPVASQPPLLSTKTQTAKSFFPPMRLRTFSHDRPVDCTPQESQKVSPGHSLQTPAADTKKIKSVRDSSVFLSSPAASLPNIVSPEAAKRGSITINPGKDYSLQKKSGSDSSHLDASPSFPKDTKESSSTKFDIFVQKAEAKLAQREEMIDILTNQTSQLHDTIISLQQDIAALQKQLIHEQDLLQRECNDTSTAANAAQEHQGGVDIDNLLHAAFHEFEFTHDERSDFVCLDANYVRRLCHQVLDFTVTRKRMEKQLPFVKGMCDQIVETLRDQLASVEQAQAQVEHSRLNELSTKSNEQNSQKEHLSTRLSFLSKEIIKYQNELEQENYTNKALRDAVTIVETDKANFEMNMLNKLSSMHAEKEEISEEYKHQISLKSELAAHMHETMERTRFNYRASGLFARSSEEDADPNAIVLLETQPQSRFFLKAVSIDDDTVPAWGIHSSSVQQAFRHPQSVDGNPSDNRNSLCKSYCSSASSAIQKQQQILSISAPPQSREEKLWNRTYVQAQKALGTLDLLILYGADPNTGIIKTENYRSNYFHKVAGNVNEILKTIVQKMEKAPSLDIVVSDNHDQTTKNLAIKSARDDILDMIVLKEDEKNYREYKALIESLLILNLY